MCTGLETLLRAVAVSVKLHSANGVVVVVGACGTVRYGTAPYIDRSDILDAAAAKCFLVRALFRHKHPNRRTASPASVLQKRVDCLRRSPSSLRTISYNLQKYTAIVTPRGVVK